MSSFEIVRRTQVFFKSMDKLEELTISFFAGTTKEKQGPVKIASGPVFRGLTELKIRKICGEVIYRAGVQQYTLGRVSEEKFADNTLFGKVSGNKSKSPGEIQYFHPSITLERENAKTLRTFGECECELAREGTLCTHMAALLIAWARQPQKFEEDLEYLRSRFEEAQQNVLSSLEDLLSFVESSSTKAEVFALLQETYSQIKSWGNGISEAGRDPRANVHFDPFREFSSTINYVSLAIMAAVERKYSLEILDLYNSATLATFGRVLTLFVESTGDSDKSPVRSSSRGKQKAGKKSGNAAKKTVRSWDLLIENFTKAGSK